MALFVASKLNSYLYVRQMAPAGDKTIFDMRFFIMYFLCLYYIIYPPPLSRDRRGRGGAMSHSIDRLFPLLTVRRVGVEVVNCQACPVDYVFQPCGKGPSSSPLAIH